MTIRVLLQDEEIPKRRPRGLRWAEYVFLFFGLIALDYCIWVSLDATFYQAYESWAFDQQMNNRPVSFYGYVRDELGTLWSRLHPAAENAAGPAESPTGAESPAGLAPSTPQTQTQAKTQARVAPYSKQPKPKPLAVIGRIEVPRLRLSAMVREGVEEETLRRAVGHVPYTPLPGQPGNVGLAGHRDTFFRKLRDIKSNDKIVISTLHGDYDYQVESIKIVTPKDVDVLAPTPGQQALTLVTCYPFNYIGSAPKRFIVRAKLLEPSSTQLTTGL